MREHQIVITLKPEQFQEVQRLARAAGAKSMGIFVRQKLLSILKADASPPAATPANAANPNLKRLTGELRRLHGELKLFVAESLVQSYIDQKPPEALEPPPQIISELPAVDDLPSLTPVGLEFPHLPDGDISEEEALSLAEEVFASLEEARDELEQLASKAFAISPRLGILELPGSLEDLPLPVNDEQADPLKELLFDDLGNKAAQPTAENEEVFDLPIRFVEKDKKPNPASQKDSEAPTTAPSVRPASQSSVLPGSPFSGGPPPRKRPS